MQVSQIEKTILSADKLYALFLKADDSLYVINLEFFLLYTDFEKAQEYVNISGIETYAEIREITNKPNFFKSAALAGNARFLLDGEGNIYSLTEFSERLVPGYAKNVAISKAKPISVPIKENNTASSAEASASVVEPSATDTPLVKPAVRHSEPLAQPVPLWEKLRKAALCSWIGFCALLTIVAFDDNEIAMGCMFATFAVISLIMLKKKPKRFGLLHISAFFVWCGIDTLIVDKEIGAFVILLILAALPAIPAIIENKPKRQ